MALEVVALRTDECRRRLAEVETIGKSFVVTGFALGNAGHDPSDPTTALTPDPGLTECQAVVFGPKTTSGFTYKDAGGTADGITELSLKASAKPKTKLSVKGSGATLANAPLP